MKTVDAVLNVFMSLMNSGKYDVNGSYTVTEASSSGLGIRPWPDNDTKRTITLSISPRIEDEYDDEDDDDFEDYDFFPLGGQEAPVRSEPTKDRSEEAKEVDDKDYYPMDEVVDDLMKRFGFTKVGEGSFAYTDSGEKSKETATAPTKRDKCKAEEPALETEEWISKAEALHNKTHRFPGAWDDLTTSQQIMYVLQVL